MMVFVGVSMVMDAVVVIVAVMNTTNPITTTLNTAFTTVTAIATTVVVVTTDTMTCFYQVKIFLVLFRQCCCFGSSSTGTGK